MASQGRMAISSPVGPPTAQLPPIGKIKHTSITDLLNAIHYLNRIYSPEVRCSTYIDRRLCSLAAGAPPLSPRSPRRRLEALKRHADGDVTTIRADAFEKSYAVRWLTALVSQADFLGEDGDDWETAVQDAAGLLAICAGAASAGTRSRVFAFSSRSHAELVDVKVHITDLPLDNQDYTSMGAQTWGGACLLADMIIQTPDQFGLCASDTKQTRILELGAGTGLVGLAAGKVLDAWGKDAELVTTDFHPDVLENLQKNVSHNFPSSEFAVISTHFLDWSQLPDLPTPPFDRPFDIIYGADVVYELEHARWIKTSVEAFLRKPSLDCLQSLDTLDAPSTLHPRFHLVVPLRSTHAAESQTIEEVFPFAPAVRAGSVSPPETDVFTAPFTLAITGKEMIACEDLVWADERREIEYIHYIISWV